MTCHHQPRQGGTSLPLFGITDWDKASYPTQRKTITERYRREHVSECLTGWEKAPCHCKGSSKKEAMSTDPQR